MEDMWFTCQVVRADAAALAAVLCCIVCVCVERTSDGTYGYSRGAFVLSEQLARHEAESELGKSFFIFTNTNITLKNHNEVCATKEIKDTLKHLRRC